ncbi:MAG: ATP-binding protein [Chloroflexi bacterium]|nr:ATP-binding protein [Chloroflexota bacterium]
MTKIVIASGKGGTGKTLVATSLALTAARASPCTLLDADVEAPNSAIFVKPELVSHIQVERLIPRVDAKRCTHHGRCAKVCQYHAIAALPTKTLVFEEICHACGSCAVQCPEGAISEEAVSVGVLDSGWAARTLTFIQGTLNISQAMSPPVIRALKQHALKLGWDAHDIVIIDAPPGTACPAVEALKGADVALLVTEPTPFGLHDLTLAVEVARDMLGLPVGVVLNKSGDDDSIIEIYCHAEGLPILLRIPLDRHIAEAYSDGIPLVLAQPPYQAQFHTLLQHTIRLAVEKKL